MDFAYFAENYRLIAADLSKIRSTQDNTRVIIYYILEKSKETILEFSIGTTKVL